VKAGEGVAGNNPRPNSWRKITEFGSQTNTVGAPFDVELGGIIRELYIHNNYKI
jgi:hypothetical protein